MAVRTRTVASFIAGLSSDRRREFSRVRDLVRKHLPAGYEEVVSGKMVVYQVPIDRYPDTYNGHPLWYVALASEKSYLSLHLMPIYGNEDLARRLKNGFRAAGKELDMGKACIRFHKHEDLDPTTIGEIVAAVPMDRWIAVAKSARRK
jgi:hypothetical protein